MKMESLSAFASFFAAKAAAPIRKASPSPSGVYATAAAQPHVLQGKMKEKNLTHGETVVASLSPVRLEAAPGGIAIYFCPMRTLDVAETLAPGDGGEIPAEVAIEGLTLSSDFRPGLYSLKNVRLTSNGAIQIRATAATELNPVVEMD